MTILILSALETKERQIVLSHLENYKIVNHPFTKTDYYESERSINGIQQKIILGRTDQTNYNAGIETERAINFFNPNYVFFIGVAGGLKDVAVGDIVIGQDVYGYERGKTDAIKEGESVISIFKPRPKFGASSYSMERLATNYSNSNEWKARLQTLYNTTFSAPINIFTGTIASGEKVDADVKSELHKFIKQNCSHALAIEMEGLGFLESCRAYPQINSLLIRGISDMVDDKANSDSKGSQEYASKNAASFLFGLLDKLENASTDISNKTDKLLNTFCKLYPEGVKDNNIFKRAGGDLSRIKLNTNGYIQWYDVLELINNGGSIPLDSLINKAREDFPNNIFL
jgi:nucleoside phosphorylase